MAKSAARFTTGTGARSSTAAAASTSAGGRTYDNGRKAWVGGYRGAAVDMKYGVPLANVCFGATTPTSSASRSSTRRSRKPADLRGATLSPDDATTVADTDDEDPDPDTEALDPAYGRNQTLRKPGDGGGGADRSLVKVRSVAMRLVAGDFEIGDKAGAVLGLRRVGSPASIRVFDRAALAVGQLVGEGQER